MLDKLFGSSETIEELIIKKPFNEKAVEKKLAKSDFNKNDSSLLHHCAKYDAFNAVNYLLSIGVKFNSLNEFNENALFTALKSSSLETSKLLLKKGIDVNQENLDGEIPLHLAFKYGAIQLIDIIASKTQDINKKNKVGRTVLFYAIESKNRLAIKKVLALSNELDINQQDNNGNTICHLKEITADLNIFDGLLDLGLDLNSINNKGQDFLYLNCLDLDLNNNLFSFAIRNNASLNRRYGTKKNTLLIYLIDKLLTYDIQVYENKSFINKYQDRIMTFVENGANVNLLNLEEENLLFNIIRARSEFNLDFILKSTSINVNQTNAIGNTVLDIAIFNGKPNIDLIKRLLFSNIDSSLKDKNNHSVIEKVVDVILSENSPNRVRKVSNIRVYPEVNYNQILNLLLEFIKVDINEILFEEEPIIFEIAKYFNVPLLETFKKYGANLDILSKKDNLNAFYRVLQSGKEQKNQKQAFHKTLNFLILNNVNIDCKDSYGGNVIHKAILDHDLQVINILTKRVGDYRAVDNKGRNYIHNTVWSDKIDILKKIALKNRDLINKPDRFGILPINYAVIMGKKEVVFSLIKLGAFLNNHNKINQQFKESFFSKLGDLDDILNTSMTVNERSLMTKLVSNMKEEFHIKK
ncbi:ankyrin repeat domain-containing protein [Arcobacter roscoffensis]|uniref:Ankyrin repeat domain-containing protein n=1 Tax=Arcobacter roscoffensis TaxID=2961520 RepID=A0ABY5E6R9_9BACT|nr:ankyrin repeat domain-containing protein [Arcobacter roscoffensis]UTJ07440.1 ankyrin repeat domain-containing protein [Arcobacter roscoffensis]